MHNIKFLVRDDLTFQNLFKILCEQYGYPIEENQIFISNTNLNDSSGVLSYTLRLNGSQLKALKNLVSTLGLDFKSNFNIRYNHFHSSCDIFGEYHEGNVYEDEDGNYDIFYTEGKYQKIFMKNRHQLLTDEELSQKYGTNEYEKYFFSVSHCEIREKNIFDYIKKKFENYIIELEKDINNSQFNKFNTKITLYADSYLESLHKVIFSANMEAPYAETIFEIMRNLYDGEFKESDNSIYLSNGELHNKRYYLIYLSGQNLEELKSVISPLGIDFKSYFSVYYSNICSGDYFDSHEGICYLDECGNIDVFYINGKYHKFFNANKHLFLSEEELRNKYFIQEHEKYLFSVSLSDIKSTDINNHVKDLFKESIIKISNTWGDKA